MSGQANVNVVSLGNVSGAVDIDLSQGDVFTATITGVTTFTIVNPRSRALFVLDLTMGGAGGYAVAVAGEVSPDSAGLFDSTLAAARSVTVHAAGGGSLYQVARNATPAA